jgi:hypothetical protein
MPDLIYPGHPGCAGAAYGYGGTPRPCPAEPTGTVAHRYTHPRPHTARLYVCAEHADGEPDWRALDERDRAELEARRARGGRVHTGRSGVGQTGGNADSASTRQTTPPAPPRRP